MSQLPEDGEPKDTNTDFVLIPCTYEDCNELVHPDDMEIHELFHISGQSNSSPLLSPSVNPPPIIPNPESKEENESKAQTYETPNGVEDMDIDIPDSFDDDLDLNLDDILVDDEPSFDIPCEYPMCDQLIPSKEYNDHMQLHILQEQEELEQQTSIASLQSNLKHDTDMDYLMAQQYQEDIYRQEAKVQEMHEATYSQSKSFGHLKDYQRVAMHTIEPLITDYNRINKELVTYHEKNYLSNKSKQQEIPPDTRFVDGIVPALRRILDARASIEYYLCDNVSFFWRGREDYSWGCGFRNLQTLSSTLLRNAAIKPIYKPILFNNLGYIPSIDQIQRYLDYAHAQGFDPEGLRELGATEGTKSWIGAVDVTAMLRSFSVPACVYDFVLPHRNLLHETLFDWVWEYFKVRTEYRKQYPNAICNYFQPEKQKSISPQPRSTSTSSTRSSPSPNPNASASASPSKRKRKRKNRGNKVNLKLLHRCIMPLYFQHEGHSRTIIGIMVNHRSKVRHLLILDPSVKGGGANLLRNIKNGKIGQVTRTVKQVRALKYQILSVPAVGLMSKSDRELSKILDSVKVPYDNTDRKIVNVPKAKGTPLSAVSNVSTSSSYASVVNGVGSGGRRNRNRNRNRRRKNKNANQGKMEQDVF